ncbi:MAG TPA: efflux transporter outer membrane subunit, partial [Candidatus Limnocylindria bacterium]|nr:efflux transporter outer membrane subunit [Candidatus Limnocylindria bacterium]
AAYKAAEFTGHWKEGRPLDTVPRGSWWEVFGDTSLNQLEAQALQSNPGFQAALARVEESRATARVARGALLPSLAANPRFVRQGYSPNQVPSFGNLTASTLSTPLDLSYEVDLWGRVRRGFESARDEAQASFAALNTVLLTLQADVAQNYFTLRALDAEIATVSGSVNLRREQVRLVRFREENGLGNALEIAQAETELANAEAEAASLAKHRDELENALALLTGANPSDFKLAPLTEVGWNVPPPSIPAGLPAELLERRPDVAEAERQLAAANAKIGIAKASFFPVLTLTGSGGFLSADVDTLFNWNSRTWSIGPSLSLPIFAGGRNRANYRRAQAAHEEAIAHYRERVLVAFGEVESSLSGIRHLAERASAQERAVSSSRQAANLADDRYRAGASGYLEVVDADREALTAERAGAQLAGQRLVAAVQLIKALGGGWTERELFAAVGGNAR